MTCRTCIHHAPSPELTLVECRRYPPTLTVAQQGIITGFPQPRADWICGEWKSELPDITEGDPT